jgi:hypothetical protein
MHLLTSLIIFFGFVLVSPAPDSLAVDSRRLLQFITPIFVAIGYQLGVLIRVASNVIIVPDSNRMTIPQFAAKR